MQFGIWTSCDDGISQTPSKGSIECVLINESGQFTGPRIPGQWGYLPEIENECYACPTSTIFLTHTTDLLSGQDIWVGSTTIDCFCDSIGVEIVLPSNILVSTPSEINEDSSSTQIDCPGISLVRFQSSYENYTAGDSLVCLYDFDGDEFDFTQRMIFVEEIHAIPAVVSVGCWPNPVINGDSVNIGISTPASALILIRNQQNYDTLVLDNPLSGGYFEYQVQMLTSAPYETIIISVGSDEFSGNVCVE